MHEKLLKGWIVAIDLLRDSYWRIGNAEALAYKTGDSTTAEFASIAAGADSTPRNISVLEPSKTPSRLFYVVPGTKDGCRYAFAIPSGVARFGTDVDKTVAYIEAEPESPYYAPNELFGFWLIWNTYPAITARNRTGIAKTPKVWFYGMKYDVERVTDSETLDGIKEGRIPVRLIAIGGVRPDVGVGK